MSQHNDEGIDCSLYISTDGEKSIIDGLARPQESSARPASSTPQELVYRMHSTLFTPGRSSLEGLETLTELRSLLAFELDSLEFIGSGGMGTIFKAHHRLLNETVAIKVLHSCRDEASFDF